jgi:hypothetical protein
VRKLLRQIKKNEQTRKNRNTKIKIPTPVKKMTIVKKVETTLKDTKETTNQNKTIATTVIKIVETDIKSQILSLTAL